jgi:DOPA 4,5-dioxygenase
VINEYHAHVYFGAGTKSTALALRDRLKSEFADDITVHPVADGPRGPHTVPMFGVDIPLDYLSRVLGVLILHHGPHSVLIHPVTGHELLDHTHHALWIGSPQPLNLGVLESLKSADP